MAETKTESIGNEETDHQVTERMFQLMKLEIFDFENNLSMVLPCPNCFIVQTTSTTTTTTDHNSNICPGCVTNYERGNMGCTDIFQAQEDWGQKQKCYCASPFMGRKARYNSCKFNYTLDQYVKNNSAFYTEAQVKAMWPLVAFDSLNAGDRVVGVSSVHCDDDKGLLCLNCYGHQFPCSSTCDPLRYGVMTYEKCREGHIAGRLLPETYGEYAKMSQCIIDKLVSLAWEDLDKDRP